MDEASSAETETMKGEGPRARGSGTESVYKALRHEILTMERPPGSPLDETRLSEHFGMSRTPIRAALMRLEQEGLLQALPNGGYGVQTFSERDSADAIELRGTLEGLLARLKAAFPQVRFIQTFGTSETGITHTVSPEPGSTFLRFEDPHLEWKVVDDELWLRSRTQIIGYLMAKSSRPLQDAPPITLPYAIPQNRS